MKAKGLHSLLSTSFLPTRTREHVSAEALIGELWSRECGFWREREFVLPELAGQDSCMSSGHL